MNFIGIETKTELISKKISHAFAKTNKPTNDQRDDYLWTWYRTFRVSEDLAQYYVFLDIDSGIRIHEEHRTRLLADAFALLIPHGLFSESAKILLTEFGDDHAGEIVTVGELLLPETMSTVKTFQELIAMNLRPRFKGVYDLA